MCNFLSVLILRDGQVLHHPMLDSHSDLVRYFNLPDTTQFIERFAKAELLPVDWLDPSTWRWTIDEAIRPQWLEDVEHRAEHTTRAIAEKMIIYQGKIPQVIVDGCWIVGDNVCLEDVRAGRVFARGSAQVEAWDSAQVKAGGSAQVKAWGSALVEAWDSAQVKAWDSAQVKARDSAQVEAWGSARVEAWGSAQVTAWGLAQVEARGSAQVEAWGSKVQITIAYGHESTVKITRHD